MTVRQAVRQALHLISARDRRLLGISILIQMATSLLDLVGVLLVGLVGALSVTTIQSQPPPATVTQVAGFFGLSGLSAQALVGVFALAAATVLLTKSIVSSFLTRRVLVFLANRQALVSARLTEMLLASRLSVIQSRSSQETAYALIGGAGAATSQILGQLVIAATEAALLFVLGIAVLLISPVVALAAIGFFAVVAVILQRVMGHWASDLGHRAARADILSLNAIQEALAAYREVTVLHRRAWYVERIQRLRWQAAHVLADLQFIGLVPKYVFEVALVVGGFALAAYLFATQDSARAVGTLALFLAAGTRVMPSLLRLQASALALRGASGAATPTFELANFLEEQTLLGTANDAGYTSSRTALSDDAPFSPEVVLSGVSVHYPPKTTPALVDVTFRVEAGTSVGLVGRSGAGKSTLADVILGVCPPDNGFVTVGGLEPGRAVQRWPGSVAYVPQDIVLANGSVRENVALGIPAELIEDELVWEALDQADLGNVVRESQSGLDSYIGERGILLSGGQRQRLGLARAFYSKPSLLILDEATSALDAETEMEISRTLSSLEGRVTTVVIAHRLSTVRAVDKLIYLDEGRIAAAGSFDEVVALVPAFRRQADLMGLLNNASPETER